jgi:two-component system OmpR family sensor kinase
MTLRTRLVITACVLMLLALLFSGFATRSLLEGFLQERVDQQLQPIPGEIAKNPPKIVYQPDPAEPTESSDQADSGEQSESEREDAASDNEDALPRETYIAYYDDAGALISWYNLDGKRYSDKAPGFLKKPREGFVTTGGYRIFNQRVKIKANSRVTHIAVARSLHEQDSILNRLAVLQAVAGAGVLALLWLAGLAIIKRQFRPLEQIGAKADRIAHGDLSQRIETSDSRTEVGRLGLALNTMLQSIERAFRREEATNEQLREFIADASHELKTPLTSLRGYAELHRYGALDDPDKVRDAMQRIEGEALRMSALVDDLLLLARFDSETETEKEVVDLREIAQSAAARAASCDDSWHLTVNLPETACPVLGDKDSLERLLDNLLSNACRYGGGLAELQLTCENARAIVRVIDHGPGISEADRQRIFQRFVRLEPDRARESGGTGLGLAIAASVVQRHDGEIRVMDTLGGGATFEVSVPLAR